MKNKHNNDGISRREFIKAAGLSVAGIAASSLISNKLLAGTTLASPRAIGANDRLNYGIIGLGWMGSAHVDMIKNFKYYEQNVGLVAVSDVWDKRMREAAVSSGVSESQSYGDYRKLLEDKDVDVVIIAVPDHWHAKIAMDAIEAGKHVYLEKPMTRTLDEAFKLHKTAKNSKCVVQIGSQGCTDTKYHVAGKAVKDGKIGTLLWAQGGCCRNNPRGEWNWQIDRSANENNLDWKTWLGNTPSRPFDPERYFRWRKFWDYGSGIIGDLWPHRLHPLMIAMNNMQFPHRVVCLGANICHSDRDYGEEREVADATQMIAEFPDGTMIYLAGSTVNDRGPEDIIRGDRACMFFGGGKVQINPQGVWADEMDPTELPVEGPGESQLEHHKNHINCIRNGGTPNCNVDLALRVQTILSLAEKSASV